MNLPFAGFMIGTILCIICGVVASLHAVMHASEINQIEQENKSLVEYTQKIEKRNQELAKKNEELNSSNRDLHQKIYELSNKIIDLNFSHSNSKDLEMDIIKEIEGETPAGEIESRKTETSKRK